MKTMTATLLHEIAAAERARPRRFRIAGQEPAVPSENSLSLQDGQLPQGPTGLGPMTPVQTAFGDFPAQTLRKGDRVRIRDGRFLPIRSVRRAILDEEFLRRHPDAQPVLIRAGALGGGLPGADLLLAPDQTIAFGPGAGRVHRARDLLGRSFVCRRPEAIITYTELSLEEPAFVRCHGVWVELPG